LLLAWVLFSENPYQNGGVGYSRMMVGFPPIFCIIVYIMYQKIKIFQKIIYALLLGPFIIGIHQLFVAPFLIWLIFGESFAIRDHFPRITSNFILYAIPVIGLIFCYELYQKQKLNLNLQKKA
jgi:hypothetical protein